MKKQIRIFLTAVMFFTRIPCPKWVDHSPVYLQKSAQYLSLIGIIVGTLGGGVFILCSYVFPLSVAVLISMLSTILITGAFHEDGLADLCDGFGGGWTKESTLRIMKDSRIGTFGMIGLLFVLALKYESLYQTAVSQIPLVLLCGHALSRFAASTLLYTHEYVRTEDSKAKTVAHPMSVKSLVISAFFGLVPLLLFGTFAVFLLVIPVFIMRQLVGNLCSKRIGGITGDCAGAVQQLCEVVFYLGFLVLWKFM